MSDVESLISHLSGGLHPDDRAAFRQAAEAAPARASVCLGPGSIHRIVATGWRDFFDPPVMADRATGWDQGRKLIELGPEEYSPAADSAS